MSVIDPARLPRCNPLHRTGRILNLLIRINSESVTPSLRTASVMFHNRALGCNFKCADAGSPLRNMKGFVTRGHVWR